MKNFREVLAHTFYGLLCYVMLKTEQNDSEVKKKKAGWNLGSPTY